MSWVKVLSEDELPEGARQIVELSGRAILLVNHKGDIYAVDNRCPHMGAPLVEGEVTEEGTIICPRHHSEFELSTGDVKAWSPWPPGLGRVVGAISREKGLPIFPTRVEEGNIWLALEESQ